MADNEQTIGQIEKNPSTDIVIRISEFQGRLGIDIREYQKSGSYTGPTNKGIRIPVEKWKDVKELLDKIEV